MKALRLLVVVAAVAWGCATNPATGQRQIILMSEQQEVQLGRESDAQIRQEMGVYKDEALQRYVAGIGARLVPQAHRPDLPWTFTVVDEAAVNAFALPGGFIYITRGILPFLQNEAELAMVRDVILPAADQGVEFLGEVGPDQRDPLLSGARATLMLGGWPEPFGLVAIESLATGTPVVARRAGALPEIVELKGHPWFVGVQFHPELKSRPLHPHPLFKDFVAAALRRMSPREGFRLL